MLKRKEQEREGKGREQGRGERARANARGGAHIVYRRATEMYKYIHTTYIYTRAGRYACIPRYSQNHWWARYAVVVYDDGGGGDGNDREGWMGESRNALRSDCGSDPSGSAGRVRLLLMPSMMLGMRAGGGVKGMDDPGRGVINGKVALVSISAEGNFTMAQTLPLVLLLAGPRPPMAPPLPPLLLRRS